MRYLLITGWQRSGTTLLSRALNVHSRMTVVYQPLAAFYKMCRNLFYERELCISFDKNSPMDDDFLKDEIIKKSFVHNLKNISFTEDDISKLKTDLIKDQNNKSNFWSKVEINLNKLKKGSLENVLFQLLNILKNSYRKKDIVIMGTKDNYCEQFIKPFITELNLDYRCIQMIRDPRAVTASRNSGSYMKKSNSKYPLLFIIRNWRKSIAYHVSNSKLNNYMGIKYEDFVERPEIKSKEICDFLDIEYSFDVLDCDKYVDEDGNKWSHNSSFFREEKGISKDSLEKWKEILSHDEIGLIQFLCKREMNYLRYKMQNIPFGIKELLNYEEKRDEIKHWFQKFDYFLDEENIKKEIVRDYLFENNFLMDSDDLNVLKNKFFITNEAYECLLKR